MSEREKRFVWGKDMSTGSIGCSARVITDIKTGVQYLFTSGGYSGGLTVLVDREGKPLIANTTPYDE